MSRDLSRRTFAATFAAGLAGLAGCGGLNPLSDPPVTLKVYAAERDDTDIRCTLGSDALSNRPTLRRLMNRVAGEDPGTRAETGISQERADAINRMLMEQCGQDKLGGLVRYDGNWFFVGMTFDTKEGHDAHHASQNGSTEHAHDGTATPHSH